MPLNARHEDILREFYHLKFLLIQGRPKGVHTMMGKDENIWCAYHRLRGHHPENCHQLKKKIEILIQKGWLLAYVKEVESHPGKRSHPREDPNSKNLAHKKEKNT